MEVFVKNCKATLDVAAVDGGKKVLEKAVIESVVSGHTKKDNVRGMKDLILYKYENETRTTIAIENQVRESFCVLVCLFYIGINCINV